MAIDVKPQHGTAGHRAYFQPGRVRAERGGTFNQAALTLLVLAQLSWFIFLGYLVWIVV
jgi:hypothetical protein